MNTLHATSREEEVRTSTLLTREAEAFVAKAKAHGERSRKRLVSQSDFISEEIARLIKAGLFNGGDRLVEVDLAARFNVSRTIIREAFAQLKRSGLIQAAHARGVRVTKLTPQKVEQLYEVRRVLLRLAAKCAVERQDSETYKLLSEGSDILYSLARNDRSSLGLFVGVHTFTGSAMIVGAGNPELTESIIGVDGKLSVYYLSALRSERRISLSVNWLRFVDAFRDGDVTAAVSTIDQMITESQEELALRLRDSNELTPSN